MTVELLSRLALSEIAVGSNVWIDDRRAADEAGIGIIAAVETETWRADDEVEFDETEVAPPRADPVVLLADSTDEAEKVELGSAEVRCWLVEAVLV